MPRDLLEDSQPVDLLEGQDLLSNQPNEPQGFTGFLGEKQAQTENLIAQRPSMMKSMVQDPATLARFRQHPRNIFKSRWWSFGVIRRDSVKRCIGSTKGQTAGNTPRRYVNYHW